MTQNTHRTNKGWAGWPLLFIAATATMLALRITSAGSNPVEWLRVGIGALALAVLVLVKRRSFARAAIYAFGIECVGGIALFAFVDVPAVQAHIPDIVRVVSLVAPHGLP